jgi:hypothetical protein
MGCEVSGVDVVTRLPRSLDVVDRLDVGHRFDLSGRE